MIIKIWGSRGSLPSSMPTEIIREKIRFAIAEALKIPGLTEDDLDEFIDTKLPFAIRGSYGSNTSCIEIKGGTHRVICDAGTGIRDMGNVYMRSGAIGGSADDKTFHIFMSHLHWDHTQGFPFFVPAYIPGVKIFVYGVHKDIEQAFRNQQIPVHFPVQLDEMNADIRFIQLDNKKTYEIAGFEVTPMKQNHPGDSYSYRFRKGAKTFIYSTDAEHKEESDSEMYPYLEFIKGADALIFDAQYSLLDAIDSKLNWGHSSNLTGVELAVKTGVKRLILFHSEHTYSDFQIEKFLSDTRKYLNLFDETSGLIIQTAYDGLEIEL